jgi:hypothetical protein
VEQRSIITLTTPLFPAKIAKMAREGFAPDCVIRQPVGHFCDSSSRAAVEARLETKNGQIFYRLLRRKPFENAAPARLRNVARLVGAMARLSVRI